MKRALKALARGAALVASLPVLACFMVTRCIAGDRAALEAMSQAASLIPGVFGSYVRVAFLGRALAQCSSSCCVTFGTVFSDTRARIGDNVYVGAHCNIGWAEIGHDTLIGSGVHLISGRMQHRFDDASVPIRFQEGSYTRLSIGEDCWVGNGAVIMADVASHAVVGAGSVVTQPVAAYDVVAGNPARRLRSRVGDKT